MMREVRVRPEQVGPAVQRSSLAMAQKLARAIDRAVRGGLSILRDATPVDTGELKRGWKVEWLAGERRIINTAPHAARVEFGSRPRALSPVEVRRIIAWARRHHISNGLAVARKIEREGTAPRFFVRNALPRLRARLAEEFRRALKT